MLVSRLNPRPSLSFPDYIKCTDGTPTFCQQTMSQVFGEFYDKLYNCLSPDQNPPFDHKAFETFMADLRLPRLVEEEVQILNAPITEEELTRTVKSLPSHKAPGPDSLPYTYYKTFLPTISKHLLSLKLKLCPYSTSPSWWSPFTKELISLSLVHLFSQILRSTNHFVLFYPSFG